MFNQKYSGKNTVVVNGTTITTSGSSSVSIVNGKVIVNGKDVTPDSKEINISINGEVEKLEVDYCERIEVTGNVGNLQTQSGDVSVGGDIQGSVSSMSGDVRCKKGIGGNVSTMSGDIN